MKTKFLAGLALLLLLALAFSYFILGPEQNTLDQAERTALGGTFVALSDGTTHYSLEGPSSGKTVVLVHGGTAPMWAWENLSKALNTAGFRTLRYDMFGRGYSDRPAVTYDRALYQRQLLELVDTLEITQKFDLVGVSFGGATSVNFTAAYPDRVDKLAIVSPVFNNFKLPVVFGIPVIGELAARFRGINMIVERFAHLIEGHPDAERYAAEFAKQTTYKGFRQSLLSFLRSDAIGDYTEAYKQLGQQDRQTLLVWGTADTEITAEMMDEARTLLPRIKFEAVQDAGHGLFIQEPEKVNPFVLEFLLAK